MHQPANSWPEGSGPTRTPPTQPGPIGPNGGPPPSGDDALATIIPFRNGHALSGYYTSIGSLIPLLGAIAGPIAIWLGVKGLQRVKVDPRLKGTAHAIIAIVLGSIGTLISLSCVGTILLAALRRCELKVKTGRARARPALRSQAVSNITSDAGASPRCPRCSAASPRPASG